MTDPKDTYDQPLVEGEVPPNVGPPPTADDLEDGANDPAEHEEEKP